MCWYCEFGTADNVLWNRGSAGCSHGMPSLAVSMYCPCLIHAVSSKFSSSNVPIVLLSYNGGMYGWVCAFLKCTLSYTFSKNGFYVKYVQPANSTLVQTAAKYSQLAASIQPTLTKVAPHNNNTSLLGKSSSYCTHVYDLSRSLLYQNNLTWIHNTQTFVVKLWLLVLCGLEFVHNNTSICVDICCEAGS